MQNSYQALKYIVLTVSLKEAFGLNQWENTASQLQTDHRHLQTTELCDDETTALGPLGNYDALLADFDLSTECTIDLTSGLKFDCDLKDDSFKGCMDAGGQHHVMNMALTCPTLVFTGDNIGICVGASCDMDNVVEVAKVNITYAMEEMLGGFELMGTSLSMDGCEEPTIELTQSSLPGSTQPGGGEGNSDDGTSGSHANGVGLLFYGLVTALPILLLL